MKKNVRTKILKSERIEVRCTKPFKVMLSEIAVQNGITISQLIELLCTDKIKESFKAKELDLTLKNKAEEQAFSRKKASNHVSSKRGDYEKEIWRMLQDGATPTETADWLNSNGFTPQRGEFFTMNSVHSIRRRLKKERGKVKNITFGQ